MAKNCQLGPVLSYGSEGTVHSGTWCGKVAAIKVLCNQYARRVGNEVQLVRSCDHANIIKYYDLEHDQGMAYLSMEFITGGNLYEFIQTKFACNSYWTSVDQILRDVAQGMVYLHDHRIVQGDLKSHNILLREGTQRAVICDFGIAKSLDNDPQQSKKRANTTKGTIRWMAPELCAPPPEPSAPSSDVWSYGCIILEVTSAREPWIEQFNDDSLLFRTLQRKENAPIFARMCANQSGPPHLHQLLIQCCSWTKNDRPRFTDILRRFAADQDEIDMPTDDPPADEQAMFEDTDSMSSFDHKKPAPVALPERRLHGGRLTGEVYTSRGAASGRPIYEGAKGGRYYLAPSGTKVYVSK